MVQLKLAPVYWSKQHGAYITLICAWIIAAIYNGLNGLQGFAIILLLAGLNLTELLSEKLTRKSKFPANKSSWLLIYGSVTIAITILIWFFSETFRLMLPVLFMSAMIYLWMAKNRVRKKWYVELVTFSVFSFAGFIGSHVNQWQQVISIMLLLSLYFGSSVFTVKERLNKIKKSMVLLFVFISIGIILVIFNVSIFSIVSISLIILKTSGVWIFPRQFHQLPIRTIGLIEFAFQLLFIANFYIFFPTS